MRFSRMTVVALFLVAICRNSSAAQVGTAFTYQGVLENPPGVPLNEVCTFEFTLCDSPAAGCTPGTVSSHPDVDVTYGIFTVHNVDFGPAALRGEARWMQINVKCSGDAAFTALFPRVELKPAPYALALPGFYTQQNASSPNVVGGFSGNSVIAGNVGATISGGGGNNAVNTTENSWTVIAGGAQNITRGFYSVVGGGAANTANGQGATISGGQANAAETNWATVGGGSLNSAIGENATISGGYINRAEGNYATVSGGTQNTVEAFAGTVSGGSSNYLYGQAATIGGGASNTASGSNSVIAGGVGHVASGSGAAIGGGGSNTASGAYATVPGGESNEAGGDFSFAAGRHARTRNASQSGDSNGDEGTFIWADDNTLDFTSTGPNQFLIRAAGGVGINTNAPTATLTLGGTPGIDGIRFPDGSLQTTATGIVPDGYSLDAADGDPTDALYVSNDGNIGIGTITPLEKLDVEGNVRVRGIIGAGSTITIDGISRSITSSDVLGISAVGGVGIGTTSPTAALDVAGTPGVDGIRFPDGTLQTTAAGPGGGTGDGHSLDASDGNPINAVMVNAEGRVGIGTTTPVHQLDVVGDVHASAAISSGNTIIMDGTARTITSDAALGLMAPGGVGIGTDNPTATLDVSGSAKMETLHIYGGSSITQPIAGWGSNASGQISAPSGSYTTVSTGSNHSLAIRADGTLAGWGNNQSGQINVPPGLFSAVSAGSNFSLAIRQDGTLLAWGSNSSGQLNVPLGTYVAVSAGSNHGIAIRSNGALIGWGANTQGQTNVPAGAYQKISAGAFHNVAIRTDGTLVAWGDNTYGQINVPSGRFIAVAAGLYFSLGVRENGTLAGWGNNDTGQINVPVGTYLDVTAGGIISFPSTQGFGVALSTNYNLVAWGDNTYGQRNVPAGTFVALDAGDQHALAIATDPTPDIALQLLADSAVKPGSDRWTIYSDKRLKKDIEPLRGALERLLALQGRTFHWRDPASQGGRYELEIGLIADDVERVFPRWVRTAPNGYKTITVSGFEALTAEALRELREEKDCEIENLKSEISELKELMKALSEKQKAESTNKTDPR